MSTTPRIDTFQFDLSELGYGVAIEAIDPRIGRVHMEQVFWPRGEPKSFLPIKLVDC